ncbi:MAG: ATP-grasp domain-containing protein [Pirellulales bacterium]
MSDSPFFDKTGQISMKAILTFARGWNCLAAARSLGRKGIEVIAGDEYPFSPTSFSKYTTATFRYPNPDHDPAGFLDTLERVIREHKVEGEEYALIPFHKETYLIARNRARFEPLIKMAIPTIEQIDQVDDKGTLALLCQKRGLPTPETAVVNSREEFLERSKSFPYPAFVKVRRSAAAVGVKKVDDPAAAIAAFDHFVQHYGLGADECPLLQQGVPGDDYCTTFLFDHGQIRATMTYHNLRTYPVKSGTGVLRETVAAPAMERTGEALLSSLGWHGVAEVDFRWDGKQPEPLLIEVNPRFWGGLPQSVATGWDYPYLLFRLAVDGTVAPVDPQSSSVKTETPVMALLATLTEIASDDRQMNAMRKSFDQFRSSYAPGNRRHALGAFFENLKESADMKGRWEHARALLHDHSHTVSDVFSWDDPLPSLGILYPLAVFLKNGKVNTELLVS